MTLVAQKILRNVVDAKRTKAAADVKTIAESLYMFKLDNGLYPTTAEGFRCSRNQANRRTGIRTAT